MAVQPFSVIIGLVITDDPLPILRFHIDLAIVEALRLEVLRLDHFAFSKELAVDAGLFQIRKGVCAGLGAFPQGMADLLKYSLIVVATAPILCVYPFVQKYFVKGVMVGSVKG